MEATIKPTAEQLELESSIRDFFAERAGPEYVRSRIKQPVASDPGLWKAIGELGLISYFASEDKDSRAGPQELGIISRQVGHALLAEPLVEAILGGPMPYFQILDEAGRKLVNQHCGAAFRAGLETGETRSFCALSTIFAPARLEKRNQGETIRVSGRLPFIVAAPQAQYLLVSLRIEEKPEICILDLRTGKEQRANSTPCKALDLTRPYYELELVNVAALRLPAAALEKVQQCAAAATAEELAGIVTRAVAMTVEYSKTRKQFGAAIGSFQAVQHRLAEMHADAESLRALAAFASWSLQHSPGQAALTSASALRFATEHASNIVEGAIQMHGGIGFTWEYDIHLFLRRAKMIELLCSAGSQARDEALIASVS